MKKIDWHSGFVSSMKLEFIEDENKLIFDEEHLIANRAQRIDLLIIKNETEAELHSPIGAIFSKYNICEYKSPGDTLSFRSFYKALGYICLYVSETQTGTHENNSAQHYTLTLVCSNHPYKLFRTLPGDGIEIANISPGIYRLTGRLPFDTQVIVTRELPADPKRPTWLKYLTRNGTAHELINIYNHAKALDEYHSDQADNLINIYTAANRCIIPKNAKEAGNMKNALTDYIHELYKDEFDEMDKKLADKDSQIADKDSQIADLGSQIADLSSIIAQLQAQLKQQATS